MAELPEQQAPFDRPLPLRLIFPLLFVGVYLSHLTLLRLPYYWDEAGYYIPAAYDFFRTGDVIPSTTLANAHPPLPSLYLALWWKSGFTPSRHPHRHVPGHRDCAAGRVPPRDPAQWPPAGGGYDHSADRDLSRLVCPEHPGARGYVRGRRNPVGAGLRLSRPAPSPALWAAAACFAVAAWCKETAIVTPLAIALWEIYLCLRGEPSRSTRAISAPRCWMLLPAGHAAGLVCLLSPPHRVYLRQSGIPALQRDLHPLAAAHPAGPGASHPAAHRAYEHVRARAVHAGGHAPAALAGTGRNPAAAYLARRTRRFFMSSWRPTSSSFRCSGALC